MADVAMEENNTNAEAQEQFENLTEFKSVQY